MARGSSPGINPAHWRAFRLRSRLPVVAEFLAVRLVLDLYEMPGTAGREILVVHLPWQPKENGRELIHAGRGVISAQLATRYEVECPSLSEVLFLRLARQGDAEELTGLFCKVANCQPPPASKPTDGFAHEEPFAPRTSSSR
jgi:hypothetical protein